MLSEADYLDMQAAQAMARLRQTASTLADEILDPLEIRPLIQRHPWWSLGSAALGGFMSGLGLGRRRLKAGARPAVSRSHRLLAMINRRVWRVLRSAVGALFVAELRGGAAGRPGAPGPNGTGAAPRPREA